MILELPAWITLFALSFSSLLFFAMMHARTEFGESRYQGRGWNGQSSKEEADCAVCLCRLLDGDEIKELGCDHVFHMACFNKWASCCRYTTCPVCRCLISNTEFMMDDNGIKVLTFRLWDFGNGDDQSNWWLRRRGSSLTRAILVIESVMARQGLVIDDVLNSKEKI